MSPERAMPMVDIISTLPDELLCHILSFLPTKFAVTTSVLSKRWNPLWRSLPSLHFDDEDVGDVDSFISFVNLVNEIMSSRDVNQSIQTFRFKGFNALWYNNSSKINEWVNTAIKRRVKHLHLEMSGLINFPSCILRCRTLVVLKLCGFTVETLPSVNLPSLKTVHLEFVRFSKRRYLMDLLSACPILEDLQIKDLPSIHYLAGEDCSERLPRLERADISIFDISLRAINNVKFLRIEQVQLYYTEIPLFRNLTHLEIVFEDFSWNCFIELLTHCPKLQNLVVDKMELRKIYGKEWTYPQCVPECLSFHLTACTLRRYVGVESELQFARYIMQNARVLQTMTICSSSIYLYERLEMLKKLSLCQRSSARCQLLFE